jgi:hypothetical protein
MGYSTRFEGELRFAAEATASQLAALNAMLGEDFREHPEWGAPGLGYIDLELTSDFGGIRWNDAEKTYDMDKAVNAVVAHMRKSWPDFRLTGQMIAQGEDLTDRWVLVMDDQGIAHKNKLASAGPVLTCPHCGERFVAESAA